MVGRGWGWFGGAAREGSPGSGTDRVAATVRGGQGDSRVAGPEVERRVAEDLELCHVGSTLLLECSTAITDTTLQKHRPSWLVLGTSQKRDTEFELVREYRGGGLGRTVAKA